MLPRWYEKKYDNLKIKRLNEKLSIVGISFSIGEAPNEKKQFIEKRLFVNIDEEIFSQFMPKKNGRPRIEMDFDKWKELRKSGMTHKEIQEYFGLKKGTYYNRLKEFIGENYERKL